MPTKQVNHKVYLHFPSLQQSPLRELRERLTIGHELGEVVIEGYELSPRHCSFYLDQGVVMVQDHRSVAGTFLNGQQLSPGKMYIVDQDDHLRAGQLKIEIREESEPEIPAIEPRTEVEVESVTMDVEQDEAFLDDHDKEFETSLISNELREGFEREIFDELDDTTAALNIKEVAKTKTDLNNKKGITSLLELEAVNNKTYSSEKKVLSSKSSSSNLKLDNSTKYKKIKKEPRALKKDSASSEAIFSESDELSFSSTHALMRALAWFIDLLFAASFYIILTPFVDFISQLEKISAPLQPILKDQYEILLPFIHCLVLLILFRIVANLLFARSFGQLLMTISPRSLSLQARLGGVLREILGIVLTPLLDFSALFGKRTLKEVLTATHLHTNRPVLGFFTGVFVCAGMLFFFIISPLFRGLELYQGGLFVDLRSPVKLDNERVVKNNQYSHYFGLELATGPRKDFIVYPSFLIQSQKEKKILSPILKIWSDSYQESIEFQKIKNFDFINLIKVAAQLNPSFYQLYPDLKNYLANPKRGIDAKTQILMEQQFLLLVEAVSKLNLKNVQEFVTKNGFNIYSYVRFIKTLQALAGSQKIAVIEALSLGNRRFLKLSPIAGENQSIVDHFLIPLNFSKGTVYQVSLPKFIKYVELKDKFFKDFFIGARWMPENNMHSHSHDRIYQSLEVIDVLMGNGSQLDNEKLQMVAIYFQSASQKVLQEGNSKHLKLVKKILANIISTATVLSNQSHSQDALGLNPYDRSIQELNLILKALDENNRSFFGLPL